MSAPVQLAPQSADAERGVLSSIVLFPSEVISICIDKGLEPDAFYIPAHAMIFQALLDLHTAGKAIDFITLGQHLRDFGMFDQVGGAPYLNELYVYVSTAANVGAYIDVLKEKRLAREILRIAGEISTAALADQANAEEIAGQAHGQFTALLHKKSKRKSNLATLREIVKEVQDGLDDAGVILTHLEDFDRRLTLYRGDLLIVSAPTSCGKSALALQLCASMAMNGKRIGFYPLEMAQKQTLKRVLAQLGGNTPDFVRRVVKNATEPPSEFAMRTVREFMATYEVVKGLPLYIRDDLHKFESIVADIRANHATKPFDFIVIDYLQLIQTSEKFERKQLQIASITQRLKALANELQCVVCLPSQVNKQGGTREAEDAENDASALIKIHGEADKNGDMQPGRVSVWKQREGARHVDIPVAFNPLLVRFEPTQKQ